MERSDRLKFCKVCENRAFDSKKGIICKLTHDIAQFELSCDSYSADQDFINKEKERQEHKSRKWKKWDSGFLDSKKKDVWLDFFKLLPSLNVLKLVKKKYDYFSLTCLLSYPYTVIHITNDKNEFFNNMEDPINLTLWVMMLLYPIVRYFFPFHQYNLDKVGIELKKGKSIKWIDIKHINVYEDPEKEQQEFSSLQQKFFIILKDNSVHKLHLNNYTVENEKYFKETIMQQKGYKMSNQDLVEASLLSFHNKFAKT